MDAEPILAVNLPNFGPLGNRDDIASIATAAEALGYESVWTTDHVLVPDSMPADVFGNLLESLTTLTFLAARTACIGLGAGVLVLPQRDPILVAKQLATLHHLSGGRLSVAVAVGYVEQEYQFLRAPFHHRGAVLDEYLPVVRELLEATRPVFHGNRIDFDGVFFSPRPQSPVPLYVGGSSPASLRRAAALGDGWYAYRQTPAEIARGLDVIRAHGARSGFQTSLRVTTSIDETHSEPTDGPAIVGTVEEAARAVMAFARAGVDRFVIEPATVDLDEFVDQLSTFAREVMPLVAFHTEEPRT